MKRKTRIMLDILIAHAGGVFGWVMMLFWLMTCAGGFMIMKGPGDLFLPILCLGFAALHWLIIRSARRTRELVKDFRLYSSILAGDRSLDNLCAVLGLEREKVLKNLREMCRRGYIDGYLDMKLDKMAFNKTEESYVARCPGCGATARVFRTGDVCRYCGNPLTVREDSGGEM